MIQCPEFDYDFEKTHAVYLWCLHVFSLINLIVNPLIIYCIVYRSTNHMATYRWFLLLHQLAAFVADLWVYIVHFQRKRQPLKNNSSLWEPTAIKNGVFLNIFVGKNAPLKCPPQNSKLKSRLTFPLEMDYLAL